MKYLDLLTKEEIIDILSKHISEEKLYEFVIYALKKRAVRLHKEHEPISSKYMEFLNSEKTKWPYPPEFHALNERNNEIHDERIRTSELIYEVTFMKAYKDDPRSYEEIQAEEKEKADKRREEESRKYWEEMERKYG